MLRSLLLSSQFETFDEELLALLLELMVLLTGLLLELLVLLVLLKKLILELLAHL